MRNPGSFDLSRRACVLSLSGGAAFAALPSVAIARDAAGRLEATLENDRLRLRIGWRKFRKEEGFITSARIATAASEEQADDRIDAAANRGTIRSITHLDGDPSQPGVRVEWNDLEGKHIAGIEEISLRAGSAALRIQYIEWPVNIVDIGSPGGAARGEYVLHGDTRWKREKVLYPQIYFDRAPSNAGYQNIVEPDQPGSLDCGGSFVMGVFNPANGRGFGRVAPVESIDIVKLLHGRGFELFPCFRRPHRPFPSYLYFVTGGREEILDVGRQLARKGWD
jgi:hypothetical protein